MAVLGWPWRAKRIAEPTNVVAIGIDPGERLRRMVRTKWAAGDYRQGRFTFWFIFELDGEERTLSSVELDGILNET